MYDQEYEEIYYGTESVISDLYSKEESMDFRRNVSSNTIVSGRSESFKLQDYKKHIESCISQLKVYKSNVQNFWGYQNVDDVSLSKNKLPTTWTRVKKSLLLILSILSFIVLVSGAITGWPIITEFINSTLT